MSLKISKDLSLPNEAVTQTFAILAKRGVGKTYTASVMVEEMLKNNLPVVVLDPIGVWWGLRSSADGKHEGLPIIIAGGDHADFPITPDNGAMLATLVVEQKLQMVIDLSLFRKGEQTKFVTDFAETLYHKNRTVLHLVIDEADAFAPQRPFGNEARMLGAMEDLVRRGRARGIGVTMITQRPAVLNKNVLTQVEVLVALRLIAPQDRKAVDEWIKIHADEDQRAEFMQSLPQLNIGEAWFWSPGWLDIFQRIQVRTRETLDSSSTPKAGQLKVEARKMADVDLDKIRGQLAETIAKVEADDPKLLKRRIVELERQLADHKPQIKEVEVPVIPDAQVQELSAAVLNASKLAESIVNAIRDAGIKQPQPFTQPRINKPTPVEQPKDQPQMQISDNGSGVDRPVTGGAQRMLDVLGSRYPMTFTKSQLAALSKMSSRSGTFGTYMSTLRSNGLITQDGSQISLTEKGRDHVGDISSVPQTPEETIDMWRNNLSGGARRMFDILTGSYPRALTRTELGEKAEISPSSGTFGTYLSMLKRNGLIEVTAGGISASDSLFV